MVFKNGVLNYKWFYTNQIEDMPFYNAPIGDLSIFHINKTE